MKVMKVFTGIIFEQLMCWDAEEVKTEIIPLMFGRGGFNINSTNEKEP